MSEAVGVVLAVASAASFAAAGVVQQRVAARMPAQQSLSIRLVVGLARERAWMAGILLAAFSYGLQALALSCAPLAVVQPLLVTELVIALPVSAWLDGRRLQFRDWAGIGAVSLGIAATVWGAAPSQGSGGGLGRWLLLSGVVVAVAAVAAQWGRGQRELVRASAFAAAAAVIFALGSALLADAVHGFERHGLGGLASPAPYAMALLEIAGMVLVQSAFQAGPLSVTMPMLDWVEPLAAVALGVGALGEHLDAAPVHRALLALGAVVALAGILELDRSEGRRQQGEGRLPAEATAAAAACACRAAGRSGPLATRPAPSLTADAGLGRSPGSRLRALELGEEPPAELAAEEPELQRACP